MSACRRRVATIRRAVSISPATSNASLPAGYDAASRVIRPNTATLTGPARRTTEAGSSDLAVVRSVTLAQSNWYLARAINRRVCAAG